MLETKIGLIGMGTVGTGVARILLEHADRVARHAGRRLVLHRVVVRDVHKSRDIRVPRELISSRIEDIVEDQQIDVVVQLMGGIEPARTTILDCLAAGKDVVTANKAVLAEHGPELFDRARQLGRSIAFDAAVAGGIPIVTNIGQCLSSNQILSLRGILNGTSNFIISRMEEHAADYDVALAEAQRLGYAEADPTMDVDGTDAAQKLAILAHLAFGSRIHWRDIPRQGIDRLTLADLRHARELGYHIRLIGLAQLADGGLQIRVAPTLVRTGTPLAEVRGAYNAISVDGDMVGRVFFHGLGAGQSPTASAVVADLIDTVVGRSALTFRALQLWSAQSSGAPITGSEKILGRYYLRLNVQDHPGVLARIANLLGQQRISIASLIQHEGGIEGDRHVPVVIMTHTATAGAATAAVEQIDRLEVVQPPTTCLPALE